MTRPTLDDVFLHHTGHEIRDEEDSGFQPGAGACQEEKEEGGSGRHDPPAHRLRASAAYDAYTIFWREIKRYKKSKSGVFIRLIQPAIWIIVVGNTFAGTQPLIESVGFDGQYIEFMAPGVIVLTAIFTSIFGGVNTLLGQAVRVHEQGAHHADLALLDSPWARWRQSP